MNSTVMKKTMYFFVVPSLIFYLLFWVFPIIKIFQYSITDFNGFAQTYNYVGLKNFTELFQEGVLTDTIANTLIYTAVFVVFGNLVALGLAFLLDMKIRAKGFYRSVAYIPTLFSTIVVGFIWSYVYMPDYGLISSLFKLVGIKGAADINLLGNYTTALYSIVLVDIWKNIGMNTVVFLAGLQTVPTELLESGKIDGCNAWNLARFIKIPLLAASVTINITLSLINGLKAFDYPFIMTNGGPGTATQTLIFSMFRRAFTEQLFGKAAALGVVAFLVIAVITTLAVVNLNKREVSI